MKYQCHLHILHHLEIAIALVNFFPKCLMFVCFYGIQWEY